MKLKDTKKKRILFVFRDTQLANTSEYITNSLRKKYGIKTYRNLDSGVIDLIRSNLSSHKFDAIITHVPYNRSYTSPPGLRYFREMIETEGAYRGSLDILQQIKMIDDIPIIAYTGAGDSSAVIGIFMEQGGVDRVVQKSIDMKKDLEEIQGALKNLLRKYEELPLDIPKPVLRVESGYIVTEARVNLNDGLGLSSVSAISKECNSYPGNISFRKSEETEKEEPCDGKKIFDLMIMAPQEGTKITIMIEGEGANAKRHALRLYSAFSSRYSFTLDFERFET